jgi:diguanylate cyclase (GGDEF)-like protein
MPPGPCRRTTPTTTLAEDNRCDGGKSGAITSLQESVRAEQVDMLYANGPAAATVNAMAAVLAWLVTLPSTPLRYSAPWLAATLLACTGRWLLKPLRDRRGQDSGTTVSGWENRMIGMATVTGACWGIFGMLILTHANDLQVGFTAFVLGGIAAAGVVTLGPVHRAYLGFTLPIMSSLVIILLIRGGTESTVMAGLTLVFEAAMIITAWRVCELIRRNIEFRLTNESLVECLSESNRQQAEVNRQLEYEIEERVRAEERVAFLASHDALTGLPNRRTQQERFEQAVAHAAQTGSKVALLFIDLDHFKDVNDTLGHPAGDALLCEIAQRLQAILRDCDSVCRQGGDEFVLLLGEIADRNVASRIAGRVLQALSEPVLLEGREIRVGGSIGISLYPEHGKAFEPLISRADKALYRAKHDGRSRYCFYRPEHGEQRTADETLENA